VSRKRRPEPRAFVAWAVAWGLAGALALAAASATADQGAPAGGWAYDVANELMSPYCPGRTLNDCPSSQAAELKAWIVAQDAAGRPRADVENELLARYGDVILQAPKATGFGLTAYVLPVVAFAAGLALVVTFLRRQGARPAAPPGVGTARALASLDPDRARALERELEAELEGRR
jgi:cytochrome c-type biogenesis protein CcmH/NrfF